jgi:colanic acid biosynthesis glycosyl transferase WcaI
LTRALEGKPDAVMVMAPTLFSAPTALAAAWLGSAKSWLHVLDLEVDAAFEMGFIRNRRLIDGGRRVERWLLARFDRVSTISSKMRERIERKGVPPDRLIDFPNWVDTNSFRPLAVPVALRRELEIPDQACVALYSGSLGKKQGLEHVIAAARLLQSEGAASLLILIAGAGPMRAELERSAQGLTNLRFLPLQPFDRFNEFLNVADIHLLPQRRDASDLVMPSKLLAMLATGRPVVATALPDSEISRTLVDAGVVVPPEDPPALAAAIRMLAADLGRRQSMGEAAVRLARRTMHSETILQEAEARLLELIGGGRGRGEPVPRPQ